jgi:hypothetical protein
MIKTQTPDPEHFKSLTERGYTINFKCSEITHLEPLKLKLLEIGGWAVILPIVEEDLEKLLSRGRKFPGKSITKRGENCRCHSNSCLLWEANQDKLLISTGYALSDDGIWRQHTWCVWKPEGRQRSFKVVETTEKRVQYFGYIMSEEECQVFCDENSSW